MRDQAELDAVIAAMVEEIRQADPVVTPSAFWTHYGELNAQQLTDGGIQEFKRTINRNYFQFVPDDPRRRDFRVGVRRWLRHPTLRIFGARWIDAPVVGRTDLHGWRRRAHVVKGWLYAAYLAALWEWARRHDRDGLLDGLDEPPLGHPFALRYRGRLISEDLCNSVLEFTRIVQALPGASARGRCVIELGPGYGRLAWVVLKQYPDVRYILVDIPPALAIAQEYLRAEFADRRIFEFRHFDVPGEIAEEFARAQIAFLTPNQLDLLGDLDADLFVNISSLHEMRPDQIAHYLRQIERHCSGFFYTKQWKESRNPFDDIVVRREDYPIPSQWDVIFDRDDPIQTEFFEAMYRVNRAPDGGAAGASSR